LAFGYHTPLSPRRYAVAAVAEAVVVAAVALESANVGSAATWVSKELRVSQAEELKEGSASLGLVECSFGMFVVEAKSTANQYRRG
jgi:hypothetical protein